MLYLAEGPGLIQFRRWSSSGHESARRGGGCLVDFAWICCGSKRKHSKRQRTEKKTWNIMVQASESCKTFIQSQRSQFEPNSSQLAINFILLSLLPFAEYTASAISPDIWWCTMLNILRNQFPDISVWGLNSSRMFWPESLCVSVSHLLNKNNNILSSYRVLLGETRAVKHSYAILIRALEKLTRKLAVVSSKQVWSCMW